MLTTALLSMLLMLEGLQGGATTAAAFDFQHDGKSVHSRNVLMSSDGGRQTVRKQPHHQMKSEIHRSLDLDSFFNMLVTPSPRRSSLPTIMRLFPPTTMPLHMHANMPMRFGRQSNPAKDKSPSSTPNMPMRFGRQSDFTEEKSPSSTPNMPMRFGRQSDFTEDKSPNSTPNMPQRFGRSWKVIRMCSRCLSVRKPAHLISGGGTPYWSVYRTLASSQLLDTALHWDSVFNFRKKK